uniref:CUB domain-containing protein n=1 Tax=Caenorhabditis tropicalis TaxID=1561998 RepID=A0A1I7UPE5_9PELO
MMKISSQAVGRKKNEFGFTSQPKPNVTCDEPFSFTIKNQDGYGFAFGSKGNFTGKLAYQFPKKDRSQSVFFDGQIKTTKIELKCLDE